MRTDVREVDAHSYMFGIDQSARAKRNVAAFHFFYNIETPVGLGQTNHRPSVLLVQYMLDLFLSRYGSQLEVPRLSIGGEADAATDQAIRAFQSWLEVSPHAGSVPVDGIIAPVSSCAVAGPNGRYVPPLLLLNRLWTSIAPDTFTEPSKLAPVIGQDVAAKLWENHPSRRQPSIV